MAMHQTTVRFEGELWEELVEAAGRSGVSVAQFLRESAVMRLADPSGAAPQATKRAGVVDYSKAVTAESDAVWAQARQARARARLVRRQSSAARAPRSAA